MNRFRFQRNLQLGQDLDPVNWSPLIPFDISDNKQQFIFDVLHDRGHSHIIYQYRLESSEISYSGLVVCQPKKRSTMYNYSTPRLAAKKGCTLNTICYSLIDYQTLFNSPVDMVEQTTIMNSYTHQNSLKLDKSV